MEKLGQKKRKLLRLLLGSFSFTAMMFAFQACYGPPKEARDVEEYLNSTDTVALVQDNVDTSVVLSEEGNAEE